MLYPQQNDFRNVLDLSGIWDFQADPQETGQQDGWFNALPQARPLAVPGSWNEQYDDLYNYLGMGWHLKKTYLPAGWRGQRIFLRVGSACYWAAVWMNGRKVGQHEGGHLPFAFEVTDLLTFDGLNTIAIQVENHLKPTRVPSGNTGGGMPGGMAAGYPSTTYDFFPFAGLHRPVVLYTVPQSSIEDITVVTEIEDQDGLVQVSVRAPGSPQTGQVVLSGPQPDITADLAFQAGEARAVLKVPGAHFWSPEDPCLYDLTVRLPEDRYTLKIGIRTIAVQGKQILLNGQPVYLKGFGRHEDFYASGKGLNLPLLVKDYSLMRWTGANSYRTSHYPYSEEEMQLADREGFLIIDETPAVSLQFDNPASIAERMRMCLQQIDELVARDKNHPSVVMWSVANEPMPPDMMERFRGKNTAPLDPAFTAFFQTLVERARQLDPTRLVTLVGIIGGPVEWQMMTDVICNNRYWGWYIQGGQLEQARARLDQELDQMWETYARPVILTEFGADTVAGMHGHPALMWTEEYQADFIRTYLEVAARKDFVAGMHVWNFADFAAVQSASRVGGMNLKGVFTRARQPKLAVQVLRSFWVRDE